MTPSEHRDALRCERARCARPYNRIVRLFVLSQRIDRQHSAKLIDLECWTRRHRVIVRAWGETLEAAVQP